MFSACRPELTYRQHRATGHPERSERWHVMRPPRFKRIVECAGQELEEVPMTIVGGFDVHRAQITFDYVDTETGEVCTGQVRPATRVDAA